MRIAMLALLAALVSATALAAPGVQLTFRNGRVWLVAQDVTINQILAEWARVGQTTIINADRLASGRMTIELPGVPEKQALDLLLRYASGFVATTRASTLANLAAGFPTVRSQFEHIVIINGSAAPGSQAFASVASPQTTPPQGYMPQQPYAPPPQQQPYMPPQQYYMQPVPTQPQVAMPPPIGPGVRRLIGPDGQPVPDDQEDAPPRAQQPPQPMSMPPGFAMPPQTVAPPMTVPPTTMPPNTTSQTAPRSPGGVPVPGMIVPTPQPQPGQQPQRPPR